MLFIVVQHDNVVFVLGLQHGDYRRLSQCSILLVWCLLIGLQKEQEAVLAAQKVLK
jgi:hypothetical protein